MFRLSSIQTILTVTLLLSLSACGSLAEWKQQIAETPSWLDSDGSAPAYAPVPAQAPARAHWNQGALNVNSGALMAAKDRWPWASGSQLQRRAQILQMGPDYRAMQTLDNSADTSSEIHIMRDLMQQRQQYASGVPTNSAY